MPAMNMMPGGSTLQIPLDAPTSFSATAGNAQVELTWTDPLDKYATPEGEVSETGDQLVSEWDHTVLVRKTGSQPAGPNDGTVVTSSSVRNQYQTNGYTDTGLINDTVYYYAVFAYNKDGVASEGAFVSATPVAGTPLGDLTEGTLITINENGSPVEFYVAKQGYEPTLNGPDRVLMVRKDCYDNRNWEATIANAYATSDIDRWFNGTYKITLSNAVQNMIAKTKFRYTPGNGNNTVGTLERSIFALSATELGESATYANVEGSALPIASTLQIAYLNGITNAQWTRSPYTYIANSAWWISDTGYIDHSGVSSIRGSRPCFTLPSTADVDSNLALIEIA